MKKITSNYIALFSLNFLNSQKKIKSGLKGGINNADLTHWNNIGFNL